MVPRRDVTAHLLRRRELSPTTYSAVFRLQEPLPEPLPGQFVMLGPPGSENPFWRRAFSVASCRDDELEIMVRVVGPGTAYWRQAPPDSPAALLGPLGNGFSLEAAEGRIALVAGGIGLPPLLLAAEAAAAAGRPADLFHGAASVDEILEPERCARIAAASGGQLVITTDDGSAGEEGLVTDALERSLGTTPYGLILACGPLPMLAAVARLSRQHGIPAQLAMEERMACGVGVCLGCIVPRAGGGHARVCADGPVFGADELDWEALV